MRNTRILRALIIASAVAIMSMAGGGLVLAGFSNESVLYSFTGGSDGANPQGGLIFDAKGNLYGTTNGGQKGVRGIRPTWDPRANYSGSAFPPESRSPSGLLERRCESNSGVAPPEHASAGKPFDLLCRIAKLA